MLYSFPALPLCKPSENILLKVRLAHRPSLTRHWGGGVRRRRLQSAAPGFRRKPWASGVLNHLSHIFLILVLGPWRGLPLLTSPATPPPPPARPGLSPKSARGNEEAGVRGNQRPNAGNLIKISVPPLTATGGTTFIRFQTGSQSRSCSRSGEQPIFKRHFMDFYPHLCCSPWPS